MRYLCIDRRRNQSSGEDDVPGTQGLKKWLLRLADTP